MNKLTLLARLYRFRDDLVLLWRAFLKPETPLYLKGAMIGVVVYLVSPIDILPDFLPLLGIVDDVALVAFAVNWIARRLPKDPGIKTVYGPARRR
jgi:uncharacterized membrane protein YkvA (DUF1232 family)